MSGIMTESNYGRGYRHATEDMEALGIENVQIIAESLDEARLSMYVVGYRTAVAVRKEQLAR